MYIVPYTRESRPVLRLFDAAFERFVGPVATGAAGTPRSPALDVVEADASYTVKLEVPGVAKEDVKVAVEGRNVTVQAQSRRSDEKKDGDRIVYRERSVASYSRTFRLPVEVDQAEAVAKLENGVLTLTLPKRSASNATQIAIN